MQLPSHQLHFVDWTMYYVVKIIQIKKSLYLRLFGAVKTNSPLHAQFKNSCLIADVYSKRWIYPRPTVAKTYKKASTG